MLKIALYISHIYDVTLFIRILEGLNLNTDEYKIKILINPKVATQLGKNINLINEIGEYCIIPYHLNYSESIINNYKYSKKIKIWLSNLRLNDFKLISTDKSQFLSLFLLSYFKKGGLIQQVEEINDNYNLSFKYSIYFNLFHLLTCSKLMLYYKVEQSNGHIIGLKFFTPLNKNIIYLTNSTTVYPRFSLPKIKAEEILNKVVIFGSRFNDWKFAENENFKIKLFACYNVVKELYIEKEIIYIPHPLELGTEFEELNKIFDNKLFKLDSEISSEYFLYKNKDILITFSIGSTSSQSAHNMGIPSKVFYKCLEINDKTKNVFDQLFFDFPDSFFIKNLNDLFEFSADNNSSNNSKNYNNEFSSLNELIIS